MCKTEKMDKVEVEAVIKNFYKQVMSPTEIHDDFLKPLGMSLLLTQ